MVLQVDLEVVRPWVEQTADLEVPQVDQEVEHPWVEPKVDLVVWKAD